MNKKVCIIVPHYGPDEELIKFVDRYISLKSSIPLILGINNIISEKLKNYLFTLKNVYFEYVEKKGSYAARNYVLSKYFNKFNIFAFTDSDCILTSDYIHSLLNIDISNNELIAGRIEIIKPDNSYSKSIYYYEKMFEFNHDKFPKTKRGVTANLVIHRNIFQKQGFFKDSLYSGGDNYFCCLSEENNCKFTYNKNLLVLHPSRKTYLDLYRKNRRVFGGWYSRYGWNELPIYFRIFTLLYSLRPPLKRCFKIFKSNNKLLEKILLYYVLLFTRLVRFYTHLIFIIKYNPKR